MRVCYVTNLGWPAGGAEKSIQILRDELVRRGHSVLIVATDKGAGSRDDIFADVLIPQISGSPPRRLLQYFFYGRAYRELRRLVNEFRPDIVHVHTVGELSPAAVFALRDQPFVMTVHGPEEFTRALIPWILPPSDYHNATYHRRDLRAVGRLRLLYLRMIQRPAYLLALRRCAALVAPSAFIARALEMDVDPARIVQIDNGVDSPDAAGEPPGQGRFLYVGRLESVKGVDVLLRAFVRAREQCPGITLSIVGDGTAGDALKALASELDIASDVAFIGRVGPDGVRHALIDCDAVVIPSVWPENLPTVALEAMGVGRAILGSRVGGIPELVADGVSGLLTDPYDEGALAAGIVQLASEPDLCRRMGEAGRERSTSYTADIFVDNLSDLYDRALRARPMTAASGLLNTLRGYAARLFASAPPTGARPEQPGRTIAVVAPYYPPHIGGTETYAEQLVRAYSATADLRPIVVTTKSGCLRTGVRHQDGVPIVELGAWATLSNTPLNPLWPWVMSRVFDRFGVDVVHAHAPVPVFADIAVRSARHRPTVLTYHCGSMVKNKWAPDTLIRLYERHVLPRTFVRADKVVAVSATALGADEPHAEVVTPGVDIELFRPPAEPGSRSHTILFVGRIEKSSAWKGLDVLIRAFVVVSAALPGAQLQIVGDGDAADDFRNLCTSLGVADRVTFSGRLGGTALADAYRQARCVVLPSLTDAESFGITLIEAMACGTPVIGSRVGGIPFVIDDGYNGLLVPAGDIQMLARACTEMLTDDIAADQMGDNGLKLARAQYRWDLVTGRYVELVRALMAGTPPGGRPDPS